MTINVAASIASLEKCLREADNAYLSSSYKPEGEEPDEDRAVAKYYVERSFVELLILLEHLGLTEAYRIVAVMQESARGKGFLESAMGPEDPYLVWIEKIRVFVDSIASVHGLGDTAVSEIRDLKAIIKRSLYAICDTTLFPSLPSREADVHDRIEAILKCHYADLKRKPSLSKTIKNFEPDTGIPSTRTLIEYKYVTNKTEAKRVVDEILADTSGYKSPQWKSILFVIYETHRVMPEEDWNALLKDCELGGNYQVMVLSGDAKPGG